MLSHVSSWFLSFPHNQLSRTPTSQAHWETKLIFQVCAGHRTEGVCAWQVSSHELKMSNMTFSSMKCAQRCTHLVSTQIPRKMGLPFFAACRELMVKPRKNNVIMITLYPLTHSFRRLSVHIWRNFFQTIKYNAFPKKTFLAVPL